MPIEIPQENKESINIDSYLIELKTKFKFTLQAVNKNCIKLKISTLKISKLKIKYY